MLSKQTANLNLISIGAGAASVTLPDGSNASLSNLTPVSIVSGGCFEDGEPVACPSSHIFESDDGTLVQLDKNGGILRYVVLFIGLLQPILALTSSSIYLFYIYHSATATNAAGALVSLQKVDDNGVFTVVDTEQYDTDYLSQFTMQDDNAEAGTGEGLFGRLLRGGKQSNDLSERMLQTCSDPTQKTIELAIAFESSFCSSEGGYALAEAEVEFVINNVRLLYERANLCRSIVSIQLLLFMSMC